ncbi:MAG: tetratricopeptide repeat protein [Colwellia polaris]|jgi:MSHA biogenesis protein MshN
MSVINQMLKDLDKRQSDQQGSANVAMPLTEKRSSTKIMFIIVAVIVILNVIGWFGWELYSENKQLKRQAQQEKSPVNLMTYPSIESSSNNTDVNTKPAPEYKPTQEPKVVQIDREDVNTLKATANSAPSVTQAEQDVVAEPSEVESIARVDKLTVSVGEKNDTVVIVAPIKPVVEVAVAEKPESIASEVKPSLTISRSQLSPKALAANKITQAEKAMERNDLASAESLFEEILMLTPAHETARKQLAALWYGKKYYQDAINLLSQGIAIDPKAEEMRLMSARIYYEQERTRQAYNILKPINLSNSVEIQTLLANVSAELNEHESAIFSYRKLITQEPEVGRWWLGLAVSLDSLGKFVPAIDAYKQSITQNNLSTSAMQFAQQRLIELGE